MGIDPQIFGLPSDYACCALNGDGIAARILIIRTHYCSKLVRDQIRGSWSIQCFAQKYEQFCLNL